LFFLLRVKALHTKETEFGLLPTVVAYDSTPGGPNNHYQGIAQMAMKGMLPTPRASDERMHWRSENWEGSDLGSEINHLLGTRSHLNPRFVAQMMGFPVNWTELPFQSGEINPSKVTETQ
jgi:hypothetical protein